VHTYIYRRILKKQKVAQEAIALCFGFSTNHTGRVRSLLAKSELAVDRLCTDTVVVGKKKAGFRHAYHFEGWTQHQSPELGCQFHLKQ